jgi:hypothetical protein
VDWRSCADKFGTVWIVIGAGGWVTSGYITRFLLSAVLSSGRNEVVTYFLKYASASASSSENDRCRDRSSRNENGSELSLKSSYRRLRGSDEGVVYCAPIPQALPVWNRVPRLQSTLHNPRLLIPPEICRKYPEFPQVARVLRPWSPVDSPRAWRNRYFFVLLISEAYRVAICTKFLSKLV